ncbi:CDF family Co(II)/Ni(II) efflux transporter DmeF [Labrys okinawensis]|uniref:CDF family Co(II)/Ni(II) efflux transporter DmeF n=1 Tax=Labrys okinawensis TaxID=346911 RepID=UPI0039BD5E89
MTSPTASPAIGHSHVFLGENHERNERRTWAVIWLCLVMMVVEIVGGAIYGSIALMADGLHMSTHAGALLLTALAYGYARRHAADQRFTFGTGKLGDLAGYTSAIILAMIAALIGYEAVMRFIHPVAIDYEQAIAIAVIGLAVNVASVWLLGGGHHHHDHHHDSSHHHHDETRQLAMGEGPVELSIFEEGVPPRFRLKAGDGHALEAGGTMIETVRADGRSQRFVMAARDGFLESLDEIPEPHDFTAHVRIGAEERSTVFTEHAPTGGHGDNNMRSAFAHVLADAAVSVLVIVGLLFGRFLGWNWMDPVAGIVGAGVILSWSYTLIRDTGGILMDMMPDRRLVDAIRASIEKDGDKVADLHVWRLGPGHLGAIVSVASPQPHEPRYYRDKLTGFPSLSHVTVEVQPLKAA